MAKELIGLIEDLGGKDINAFISNLEKWQAVQVAGATGNFAAAKIDLVNDKVETLRALSDSCLTVPDMIKKINSIFFDAENVRVPSVVLSTVHKAKGLEWDNVYMLSSTFKSRRKNLTAEEQQEEQNIYYVGITRCRKTLNLINDL
jgi:superfamily I DNA/RNA helicase